MHEDLTTEQLADLNRADRYLHRADILFDQSNSVIHQAVCNLRRGRLVAAYRLHNDAIEYRTQARRFVDESSTILRHVYRDSQGEHCHLVYRKDLILHSPTRKITAQWCTLFYFGAGTMAVVALLTMVYMWRIGLL